MRVEKQFADEAIIAELGRRLARMRIDKNKTQAQFAENAGVSKRTVERFEGGESIQLSNFIRICRELDLIKQLDVLIPEPIPSPIAQIKLQGKVRRRATSQKTDKNSTKKWTWSEK